MKRNKRRIFISVLLLIILFISLAFLIPIEANPTENIVPEKLENVKQNEQKISKPEAESVAEPVENVQEEVVSEPEPQTSTYAIADNVIYPYPHSDFKTYMYASAVTDTSSAQYQLISQAYIGDYGIMMVDGCYLVAMGTTYAQYIGQRYQVVFETGQSIQVMIGDVKQDIHTDAHNSAGALHSDLLEFIVAQPPEQVALMGNYNVVFPGRVSYLVAL